MKEELISYYTSYAYYLRDINEADNSLIYTKMAIELGKRYSFLPLITDAYISQALSFKSLNNRDSAIENLEIQIVQVKIFNQITLEKKACLKLQMVGHFFLMRSAN